ncbi:MAG TPA: hypothetical protein PLI10_05720 [Bacillota bacterium]|nr:MAG: hypothetical protein BWY00_01034 [Firmicutes bacterium ADurb.Bin153]HNZ08777.1 hypothetical protein [Bacillota bacterium]HOH10390.1 hypothetical protein [Bacillota bacterium]HOS50899.1 hypothetical protein [Bacillota bacterium]HPI01818.1 hypothetical protein [Bacillota bacterium]
MRLIGFELSSMFKRRIKNPLGLVFEGMTVGCFLLLIEKVLGDSGDAAIAVKQVMLISSVLALPALQGLYRMMSEELSSGTAEALFQVEKGPLYALLARDASSVASMLLIMPFVLIPMRLSDCFDAALFAKYAFPVLLMRIGMLGMGLILGSLTLLFRRTATVVNVSSIIMVVTSLGVGIGKGFLNILARMTPNGLLAVMMQNGGNPSGMLLPLSLVSALWIAFGLLAYNLSVRRAKRFGFLISN